MKTFCLFLIRFSCCMLFEWLTYYICEAQASIFLTPQSKIVLTQKAKVTCHSVFWLGDATVRLDDSTSWCVHGNISGTNNTSRFFALGNSASLKRKIGGTTSYVFPVGYYPSNPAYRGFVLDMQSLGATGSAFVSVKLIPHISGALNYEKYFSGNNGCLSNSWVAFNCLSSDGWHCDGPSDYEYVASGYVPNNCGGIMRRMIKTGTNTNAWQDSIESVIGSLSNNFCDYSDWAGNMDSVPGGTYRNFSDFAIASSISLLPVKFVDVQANALNQKCIRVSWKTEIEMNNDKFLIARGTDGSSFKIIGEIPGSGNTSTLHDYLFDDCDVVPNTTYYYMVEQMDYDGAIDWSSIVSAEIEKEEVLETKVWNILGQEIFEDTPGVQIVQVTTRSGMTCSRVFKPLR